MIAPPGMMTDLNGEPTPALYGFTRELEGELLFAPVPSYGDDDIIPNHVLRSICAALALDMAIFERPN